MKLYEYTAWKHTFLPSLGIKHLFFHKKNKATKYYLVESVTEDINGMKKMIIWN